MRHTFLIARQEFIKYVTRRGFLISVLMFPLWIMIVIFVPRISSADAPAPHTIAVVDRTGGGYADAIRDALAQHGVPIWRFVPAPGFLAGVPPDAFAKAARRVFAEGFSAGISVREKPVDVLIVVPRGFGDTPHSTAEVWSDRGIGSPLQEFLSDALTRAARHAAIRRYAPQIGDPAVLDTEVRIDARDPSRSGAPGGRLELIVPIALAIILFVVSVMNSSVLLQGVVEEKSTRMIEVLLSCATPRAITAGKLIGVIAVALATLLIWAAVLFALMALAGRDTAGTVVAALQSIQSPGTLALLLLFFLAGLLIYGSIFLAIGSMAASLADAQSLLGPSMLILMLPNLLIAAVMQDPNGTLATWLTFVPIYTPFFIMLRIAAHPPVWQIWSAMALAVATTAAMILWTGRIFARHALTTERPPSLGGLVKGLLRRR